MPVWKKFASTYHIHINQLTWEYYPISVKSRYRLLVFDLPSLFLLNQIQITENQIKNHSS